jgi:hypothetical protein
MGPSKLQDSNKAKWAYESPALTIELQAHVGITVNGGNGIPLSEYSNVGQRAAICDLKDDGSRWSIGHDALTTAHGLPPPPSA